MDPTQQSTEMDWSLPGSAKSPGHRRLPTLGKAMPVTSLLLNFPPPTMSTFRTREMLDGLTSEHERPPLYFPLEEVEQPSNSFDKTEFRTTPERDYDTSDRESDFEQEYELLVSECSSDADDKRRKDNDDGEEKIFLIGNSTFYTPCLTCTDSAPTDLSMRNTAINEMCRRLCTAECRLRLTLAGFEPPSEAALLSRDALAEYIAEMQLSREEYERQQQHRGSEDTLKGYEVADEEAEGHVRELKRESLSGLKVALEGTSLNETKDEAGIKEKIAMKNFAHEVNRAINELETRDSKNTGNGADKLGSREFMFCGNIANELETRQNKNTGNIANKLELKERTKSGSDLELTECKNYGNIANKIKTRECKNIVSNELETSECINTGEPSNELEPGEHKNTRVTSKELASEKPQNTGNVSEELKPRKSENTGNVSKELEPRKSKNTGNVSKELESGKSKNTGNVSEEISPGKHKNTGNISNERLTENYKNTINSGEESQNTAISAEEANVKAALGGPRRSIDLMPVFKVAGKKQEEVCLQQNKSLEISDQDEVDFIRSHKVEGELNSLNFSTPFKLTDAETELIVRDKHQSTANADFENWKMTSPKLPQRPPPPSGIAIQRKKFLTEMLASNSDSDSNYGDDMSFNKSMMPNPELIEIVATIVEAQPTDVIDKNQADTTTTATTTTDTTTFVDPHELELLKDFREKFEIAEALAKTSAMTSTTQIKQRLAARKLEIELENAAALDQAEYETTTAEGTKQGVATNRTHALHGDACNNINKSNNNNNSNNNNIANIPDIVAAIKRNARTHGSDFEPPRDLLLYLVRMGSFNSAPKINNADSQDDDLEVPKGLSNSELLQHFKHLRGEQQPTLLNRYFLKPTSATQLVSNDITDGLRYLKLNTVSRGCSAPIAAPNHIRLLQWNILSQTLGQNNDGFVRCPEEALTWDNRKYLIVQEILQHNPDIVCLQEVDHYKFLQNILGAQNYEGIFFPKPDSPCLYIEENNGPDGCAIFFKRDKFELKNFDTRVLEVWRVQSNQVAIAANLLVKESGQEICVATTHLKARHGSLLSKLRNEQGRDLLRFLKQFAEDRPVLLCGDFNAEPNEPVYTTILSSDKLKLSSAYADIKIENDECNNESASAETDPCEKVQKSMECEPPYTTWKIREDGEVCHTIDYVFYTKDHFKVKNCLEFPEGEEIGKNRTPSFQYPSDHFSLVCDFEIVHNSDKSKSE